ncbi:MAG TPA: endonuclease/exonuclease/phosphatase family protein [Opitutus sp.]|nr:endonuclease/exonuclease/phosphatase family protein [Opitutus sp.]
MRWTFVAAFWLGFLLSESAGRESLTIATYNVENYGLANRMTDAGFRPEYPKPERQKAALRRVIRALNADIVVLQEIGGEAYLEELARDLRGEGCDYPFRAIVDAADAERKLGLLARVRPVAFVPHAGLTIDYRGEVVPVKRGLLEARFPTPAGELALFGVHLKSRYTDRADDPQSAARRTAEAASIRDAVLRVFPDPSRALFVIVGDFNDSKDSPALQRFRRRGQTPLAELMPAFDSRGEAWTHAYAKRDTYTRVDHVLLSPGLRQQDGIGAIARVFDGDGVREASDHRPVVLTLRFEGQQKGGSEDPPLAK